MGGPSWLNDTFAAVMIAIAVYTAGRLVASGRWRRPTELDADGVHLFMGVSMAGMLATGLRVLPAGFWEAVFGVGAAWFAWQVVRDRRGTPASPWRCPHPVPHLVECGAMLYMLLVVRAVTSASGAGGMAMSGTASRSSVLALGGAVFMLAYAVWLGDRLTTPVLALAGGSGPVTGSPAGCQPSLAPRCAACYKIAMGVTMGYMLILML